MVIIAIHPGASHRAILGTRRRKTCFLVKTHSPYLDELRSALPSQIQHPTSKHPSISIRDQSALQGADASTSYCTYHMWLVWLSP